MFASVTALAALVGMALTAVPAPARTPLKVVSATKPPAQVNVGDRVTIRVKIRNQSRRKDYVHGELHLQPASPLPFSQKANPAYGTRSVAAGYGPRSLLKPGQSGKAKLVWRVPRVHRGFNGKLVACATGRYPAKASQCRAIGRIRVRGSLLSMRAGVSATTSLPGIEASIALAAQELASDGRGVWWAGPERWTAAATLDPVAPGDCPQTILDTRVTGEPRGTGLTVRVWDWGRALTISNVRAELEVPTVRVTTQTGGDCASEGDEPIPTDFVHDEWFQLRPNASGVARFSSLEEGDPQLRGTLTVQP